MKIIRALNGKVELQKNEEQGYRKEKSEGLNTKRSNELQCLVCAQVGDFLTFLSMRIRADEPDEGCAIHTA